jgi:hypothetical protein
MMARPRFQTGLCGTWMHPQYGPDKKPAGTRIGNLDLNALTAKVEDDVATARQWSRK